MISPSSITRLTFQPATAGPPSNASSTAKPLNKAGQVSLLSGSPASG